MNPRAHWFALATWSLIGCSGQTAGAPRASRAPVASSPTEPQRSTGTPPSPSSTSPTPTPECLRPPIEPGPKGDGSRIARRGKPVECSPSCTSESTDYVSCVDGREVTQAISAPCDCGSMTLGENMGTCAIEHMTLRPMDDSPVLGGCELDLSCEPGALRVDCDDEEDGTGNSLCDCYLNGKVLRTTLGLIKEPGVESCYAAAPACLVAATGR